MLSPNVYNFLNEVVVLRYLSCWDREYKFNAISLYVIIFPFLWLLSWIYIFLGYIRKLYARYWYGVVHLPCKVVCVGNILVGGVGKTQVVKYLERLYTSRGKSVCIVSKGYGGNYNKKSYVIVDIDMSTNYVGDEALELRYSVSKSTSIVVARDAKSILNYILSLSIKPDIVILDDSMQNPYLKHDYRLLVMCGERWLGNGYILPAGPLRQTLSNAKYDCMIVIEPNEYVKSEIEKLGEVCVASICSDIRPHRKQKYIAVAGIGNPARFFDGLRKHGFDVIDEFPFADHYVYTKVSVGKIFMLAKDNNAKIITTSKDFIKIKNIANSMCIIKALQSKGDVTFHNIVDDIVIIEYIVQLKVENEKVLLRALGEGILK